MCITRTKLCCCALNFSFFPTDRLFSHYLQSPVRCSTSTQPDNCLITIRSFLVPPRANTDRSSRHTAPPSHPLASAPNAPLKGVRHHRVGKGREKRDTSARGAKPVVSYHETPSLEGRSVCRGRRTRWCLLWRATPSSVVRGAAASTSVGLGPSSLLPRELFC